MNDKMRGKNGSNNSSNSKPSYGYRRRGSTLSSYKVALDIYAAWMNVFLWNILLIVFYYLGKLECKMKKLFFGIIAVVAVVAAGCGSNGGNNTPNPTAASLTDIKIPTLTWEFENGHFTGPTQWIGVQNGGSLCESLSNGNAMIGGSQANDCPIDPTPGTWQEFVPDTENVGDNFCYGYDDSDNTIVLQTCSGATYQEWRSGQISNGAWEIWNEWLTINRPNACSGGKQALMTLDAVGAVVILACPQGPGNTYGSNQTWLLTQN